MKLSRDFVQIATTAIVTSAIFIGYLLVSGTGNTVAFLKSGRITWDEAQKKRDEYLHFKPLRVKHKGQSGADPEKKEDLKGFVFEASDLDEIVNSNHSGTKPDKVIFVLGQEGTFPDKFLNKSANMHVIAIGIRGDDLLIDGAKASDSTEALAPSIFDKADPCPPFCPTKLQ